MRLSDSEIKAIKEVVEGVDQDALVYLFGSRVYNGEKGGDIDLLILSRKMVQEDSGRIRYKLWDIIGEQKIDIVIVRDTSHPFTRIALKEGILL